MAVDDRISFFGVGIQTLEPRFEVISIQTLEPRFEGISIVTNNYTFGTFLVTDTDNNPIEGAVVSITSTQTNPSNFIGDLSGTTNKEGSFTISGSSTTGTTLRISKEGFNTYTGPLNQSNFEEGQTITLSQPTPVKKIWTTNKGNIMFNPNDTVLIEIS
jgi:hypothetical protein